MRLGFSSLAIIASSLLGMACSAGASDTGSTASHGNATGSAGTTGIVSNGGSTGIITGPGTGDSTTDPNDKRDLPVRKQTCDANNQNCTCLRLGMLGTLASAADDPDSQAFQSWLNTNAMGTATLTTVPTKPATIDATFLANYDILLIANVLTWSLSDAEKAAIQSWVTTTGGGIITITGFVSTPPERDASSQFTSFAGINYGAASQGTADETAPASGQSVPVFYKGGSTDLKNCLFWNGGSSTHTQPGVTTPVQFTPQTDAELSKLTLNLNYVGAFIGWPVTAPAGATVLARDPVTSGNMAVALEYMGKGRILSFGDEWVIYTNQWTPTGTPSNMQMDQGNPCWEPAMGTAAGFFQSVETLYQTKQFWFNVINWVAPPNECAFMITDPDVVVK
ncbi:MAG TPA: hypothetical protein VGM44_08370 [Polyangiaceae bacterium]|jgi:hypothetical protein